MQGFLSNTLNTLLTLQKDVDYAKGRSYYGLNTSGYGVYPPVNFFEKENGLVMLAELPGVKKEEITLEVKSDVLRLAGERKVLHDDEVSVHRQERQNFSFDRTLKLPFNVDEGQIKADFKDGLLVVELVHSEQDKPQKIAIH